ncbi:MAG: D-alanyl-D-alanine carboxypeptidase/D-alanyl-D-alanine-endopeptidase [Paludisphaera borealis]|uniref:D-alanyl-D-alanine carboxypeptidase/D-alanyl-D-alanine endopeptidase n=1 Tax=Paludisphaera borealis TaxID=1387353 RepID=UPI00284B9900|nr:D-alanyl-D-alanine carboxypeptidase/D-alanyl-D-alanine-endopeptidase [Paludisphaera borealis]MDR3619395.1 D-alanyl-D-alanine carboxypeptidase/D-alanyl-D-alanine-endopeptidase [Paludisphaera borealis]
MQAESTPGGTPQRGRPTDPRRCSGIRAIAAILAILPPLAGATAQEPPPNKAGSAQLPDRVQAVLETAAFAKGHWGLLVVDRKTGETVYERNADQFFAPASVTKLFSTAAALVELGADHRFQTPVVRRGEVDAQGSLHGDLILIAQGDLAMGGRTGPDGRLLFKDVDHTYSGGAWTSELVATDPLAGMEHLSREVQAAGIKRITGEVIVDDRLFDRAPSSGSGPERVSPIVVNDNLVDVVIQAGKAPGEPATVSFSPLTQYVSMDAQVETIAADGEVDVKVEGAGSRRFTVRGRVPAGRAAIVATCEVDDPASFARTLLIEALRRHGVRIDASPLAQNSGTSLPTPSTLKALPKVAEYTSPPFREFLRVILKVSHNLHASTLPMLLAARKGERSLKAGLKREGELLKGLGVDPKAISFGGGAGGTQSDMVTPRAAVTLLRAMAARPDFNAYDAALPVLGRDGTLAKAVADDSPARGHAHAKTGTFYVNNDLDGTTLMTSKALAGYLETATGRQLAFAFFINNVPLDVPKPKRPVSTATGEAGKLLGKLCEVFYSDSEAPAPAPAAEAAAGVK